MTGLTASQSKCHISTPIKRVQKKGWVESQCYDGSRQWMIASSKWHFLGTSQDRKALQQVIKTGQNIISTHLLNINDIHAVRIMLRTQRILKEDTQTSHSVFILLHLASNTKVICCCTTRLRSSFFP